MFVMTFYASLLVWAGQRRPYVLFANFQSSGPNLANNARPADSRRPCRPGSDSWIPKDINFPRYYTKCRGGNVILCGIFHVVYIMFSTTFHVISRKFWLLFGQCIMMQSLYKYCIHTAQEHQTYGLSDIDFFVKSTKKKKIWPETKTTLTFITKLFWVPKEKNSFKISIQFTNFLYPP